MAKNEVLIKTLTTGIQESIEIISFLRAKYSDSDSGIEQALFELNKILQYSKEIQDVRFSQTNFNLHNH